MTGLLTPLSPTHIPPPERRPNWMPCTPFLAHLSPLSLTGSCERSKRPVVQACGQPRERGRWSGLTDLTSHLFILQDTSRGDVPVDPFRAGHLILGFCGPWKINEQFSDKAREFINGGKPTARSTGDWGSRHSGGLSLSAHDCRSCGSWCEKVPLHGVSDARGWGLGHQGEAFGKQLHLHHEALKDSRIDERQALLGTTKFFEAFSFSLGGTNKSSLFHPQEDGRRVTRQDRSQADSESLRGPVSGPADENYCIPATRSPSKSRHITDCTEVSQKKKV